MTHLCPLCKGLAYRVPQRGGDWFVGLFGPVERYQCQTFTCRWEWRRRGVSRRAMGAGDRRDTSR